MVNVTNLHSDVTFGSLNSTSVIMALVLMAIVIVHSFCYSLLCKNFLIFTSW